MASSRDLVTIFVALELVTGTDLPDGRLAQGDAKVNEAA